MILFHRREPGFLFSSFYTGGFLLSTERQECTIIVPKKGIEINAIVNKLKKGILNRRGILRFRCRMYIIQYEGVYPAAKVSA